MKKTIRKTVFIFFMILMVLSFVNIAGAADRPLRMASGWPAFIDPAVGSDLTACKLLVNIYDTLIFNDSDTGLPGPFVAKSWEVTDEGKTWIFYLNEGINFHDGSELTAEDVKFSMDRITTIGEGYAYLFLDKVASSEVIDKYTISFHLKYPIGPFLGILSRLYILNEDLVLNNIEKPGPYGDLGDYGKQWLNTHDAGSGPYIVKEYLPEESVTLDMNPNYWRSLDPEVPDELIVYNITESTTIKSMLLKRDLEMGYHASSRETLEALDKIEGIDIKRSPQLGEMYFMLNTKKAPTDDVHFRKAMAWGLDYQTIVAKTWYGVTESRGPIPKGMPGYDPTVLEYKQDFGKAQEELQKSKYYQELDKYPVDVYWLDRAPDEEKIALLFMSNMAKLGIKVRPIKVPWAKVVEDSGSIESSPHIVTATTSGDYLEAGSLLETKYKSASAATWEQNEWLLDPELDQRIDDAIRTIDQKERFAEYSELIKYIHEDLCPTICLFDMAFNIPYQSAYMDWPDAKSALLTGYEYYLPNIKIYPEKRKALLDK